MCSHPEQEAGLTCPDMASIGMDGHTDTSHASVDSDVRKM